MDFEQARFNMVEQQIRPWNVLNQDVLNLLSVVKREQFVPEGMQNLAFTDCELPIKINGKDTGHVMLAPKIEAKFLQEAQLKGTEKVLQIGAGTGYLTALLAAKSAHVTAVEAHKDIAEMARNNLKKAGVTRVKVLEGCGFKLAAELGQFDLIVLTGSVEVLPEALIAQLQPGGRLIAIVGKEPVMEATLVTKNSQGQLAVNKLFETLAKPLQNGPKAPAFSF